MLKRTMLLTLLTLMTGGCCTKMLCTIDETPVLEFHFQQFDEAELREGRIFIYEAANGMLVDSSYTPVSGPQQFVHSLYTENGYRTVDQLYFVVRLAQRVDTIRDVRFEAYSYKIDCNTCVLADGRETVTNYTTRSYRLGSQEVTGTNVVTISK